MAAGLIDGGKGVSDLDELLDDLADRDFTILEAVKHLWREVGLSLGDAKQAVTAHPHW